MIYRDFQDKQLSLLGFGTMRLPQTEQGTIDQPAFEAMVDEAVKAGVNYFDTAQPYHGGKSEIATGLALKKYPRESFYLATKYPGHQLAESYDPEAVFEDQLKKCGVEYFDFYLLHNVCESSIGVYKDPKWGILDYFVKQKELGRIKHLGFSSHGGLDNLKEFLDYCGEHMEFCQIQLNYMDWTLQRAKEKVEMLNAAGIPVWVMEPVRGGALANLADVHAEKLAQFDADASPASFGFRFLQDIPGVTMVLSGMSNMEQTLDNLNTFKEYNPLSDAEKECVLAIAEELKDSVPCTRCRYCVDGCPMGLDIPTLIASYNESRVEMQLNIGIFVESLPEDKRPSACIGCGACTHICPQNIDIPGIMEEFAQKLSKQRSWAEICKERAEAAKNA
ncbi:MAG: aldo/keto reductase [Oscillospiraceae bacterium]|nr:aldo/keto reductase [Oscillospiraceae bacterium]